MSKIEELTKEQEALLHVYRDKWLKIGLCTEPANRKEAEEGIRLAYKIVGLKDPQQIIWTNSPLGNVLAKVMLEHVAVGGAVGASVGNTVCASIKFSPFDLDRDTIKGSVWESAWDSVKDSIGDFVRAPVWTSALNSVKNSVLHSVIASVSDLVRKSVKDLVWVSVKGSVWTSACDSVRDSIGDSIWVSVWGSARASARKSIGDLVCGQHDAFWFGFYEFFHDVLGLTKETQVLSGLWQVAKNAGWWLPCENICFISERHNICNLKDGRIHCEDGPAIAYPDGFEIYALNGVRVPKEVVMTPAEELDPRILLKKKNAEVRREIVRKIGIERVCQRLGAQVLDKKGDYELLNLDLGDGRRRPYLKMKNPSIGVFHLEGVPPDIDTVEKALRWRNQTDEEPIILT